MADQWDDYNARFKALANWVRNVAEPFDMALARGKEGEALASFWAKHRSQFTSYSDAEHPFRLQGSADLNSYKMFTEAALALLRSSGRIGVILPNGIYSDLGSRPLRQSLFYQNQLEYLYVFQNEKKVFDAAFHGCRQVALFATRGGHTSRFLTRFRMGVGGTHAHEIPDDILRHNNLAMQLRPEDVVRNSPKSLSLVQLRSERELRLWASSTNTQFGLVTTLLDGKRPTPASST